MQKKNGTLVDCFSCGEKIYRTKFSIERYKYFYCKDCNRSNRKHSEDTRNKIGCGNKGKKRSLEVIKKMRITSAVPRPYMKGRKMSTASREKMSLSHIGYKHTDEWKQKMSMLMKGRSCYWLEGKPLSEDHKLSIGLSLKNKKHSLEHNNKVSEALTGRKIARDIVRKSLIRKGKSSLELKFESLLNKYNLPYKYVDDKKMLVGNRNPDFIHKHGARIAIEVYCKKHKEFFKKKDINEWKREREEYFSKHGWKIYFFDEKHINDENVLMLQ